MPSPSRHCHLGGTVYLRDDLDDDDKAPTLAALAQFYRELGGRGDLIWGYQYLHLHLSFTGEGSPDNPVILALADALSAISRDGGFIEVLDRDSPDREKIRFPYFVGPDQAARDAARSEYASIWRQDLVDKLKALKKEGLTLNDCVQVFATE
jgi:hypothetical protein